MKIVVVVLTCFDCLFLQILWLEFFHLNTLLTLYPEWWNITSRYLKMKKIMLITNNSFNLKSDSKNSKITFWIWFTFLLLILTMVKTENIEKGKLNRLNELMKSHERGFKMNITNRTIIEKWDFDWYKKMPSKIFWSLTRIIQVGKCIITIKHNESAHQSNVGRIDRFSFYAPSYTVRCDFLSRA